MRHDLAAIDISRARGLEIGPLMNPRVRKSDGAVFYVDHVSTEELREKYRKDHRVGQHLDEIVEIDYVVRDGKSVSAVTGPDAPFDYVVASHVIEHIPDPVGWIADIATILAPGGILSLVVPDKRYCFDINRSLTETSDLIDAYLRKLTRPSFRQIYDFISRSISDRDLDTGAIWAGTADYSGVVRQNVPDPAVAGLELCRRAMESSQFIDIHCQVFTPSSFLTIFRELAHLDLIDYEIAHFGYTEVNNLEFYVSLRLLDTAMGREMMKDRQMASVAAVPPEPDRSGQSGLTTAVLSARELRMVTLKRQSMSALRDLRSKLRGRSRVTGRP